MFHFDMYRLSSADELFDIGWEDYLVRGGVCAVEWSENVSDAMEGDCIRVDIRRGTHDSQRLITIEGGDAASRYWLWRPPQWPVRWPCARMRSCWPSPFRTTA